MAIGPACTNGVDLIANTSFAQGAGRFRAAIAHMAGQGADRS